MPQISVIVPVYNVELYIERCVKSILSQTYSQFELILVDDGSPDRSGMLCDEFARSDERIHVIHQENGGLSAARNAGIDWVMLHSKSEWITFVDSDDWVHPLYLETLLETALKNEVQISTCTHTEAWNYGIDELPEEYITQKWTSEDYFVFSTSYVSIAPAKLYHRSCLKEVRFPKGKIHEDEFTTYRLLFSVNFVAEAYRPLYYYFQNPNGITQSEWKIKRLDCLEALRRQISFFRENGFPAAYKKTAIHYGGSIVLYRDQLMHSNVPEEQKKEYYRKLTNQLKAAVWKHKFVYLQNREFVLVREAFPGAFGFARKVKMWLLKGRRGKNIE